MKHLHKYFMGALVVIILVAALPTISYAEQRPQTNDSFNFSVSGTQYSVEKKKDMIRVQELNGSEVVNSCTAYLDEDYILYEDTENSANGTATTDIIWLDSMVNDIVEAPSAAMTTKALPSWTKDGKYIYKPTLVSIFPSKYREHTAYYMYRNMGTLTTTKQIQFAKGTKITVMTTILGLFIGTVVTLAVPEIAAAVALGLVTQIGTGALNGYLLSTISPKLAVNATRYDAKFVDPSGNGTGQVFSGEKAQVIDRNSNRYNRVFYEGYAPQLSQNFAYAAFVNTFKGNYVKYPGLKSYVEL